jgi:Domain of unknown function (DUF4258)
MLGTEKRLRMTKPEALRVVRDAARDSARVFLTPHAEQRIYQRKITRTQVLDCLRKGSIIEGPAPTINGEWECTVER